VETMITTAERWDVSGNIGRPQLRRRVEPAGQPMSAEEPRGDQEITLLLQAWRQGDDLALEHLVPLVYNELHRIAGNEMGRERRDHTLQPTALVNEVYLRLVNLKAVSWNDRAHFFAVAARSMRRILVDRARAKLSAKRGGFAHTIALEDAGDLPDLVRRPDLVALDAALARLGQVDSRRSQVVELRYFGGLDVNETAAVLNVSRSTVIRDWTVAKAWPFRELSANPESPTAKVKSKTAWEWTGRCTRRRRRLDGCTRDRPSVRAADPGRK